MAELTDHELLTRFAHTGEEAAFATLVTRHVNLVWSAARRFTGDDTLASEVTQAVFIILAQKAGRLSAQTVVTGWLYHTARLTAANALKENRRRQQREHQAYMEATLTPNETNEAWQQLAPVLDEAMHALRTADRDAVLLRFFENKSLADVGAALGVTEDAARVRVNRALDKLRALLAKQGIKFGATAIATAVAANAVSAAPAMLAATITTAVLTGTGLTLATVAMTTFQKIAVTAALTVTIGGGLFAAKQAHDAQNAVRTLQAQQAPLVEQVQQLQAERDKATNQIAGLKEELANTEKNNLELLKLRGEVGVLKNQAEDASQKTQVAEQKLSEILSVKAQFSKHEKTMVNNAKQIGLAMLMFSADNNGPFPTDFQQVTNYVNGYTNLVKMNAWDFDLVNIPTNGVVEGFNQTNFSKSVHPDLVVLRERYPRQSPDGSWSRIYGLLDGRVLTATSYDGSFAAWEKINTYSPSPPITNQ